MSEDPFEAILFPEDRLKEEGYWDGCRHGHVEGRTEGFVAGQQKGVEVASEVGFYLGFTEMWLSLLKGECPAEDKAIRTLTAFEEKLKEFQILNFSSPGYFPALTLLRAKFKQVASLLRISPTYESTKHKTVSF